MHISDMGVSSVWRNVMVTSLVRATILNLDFSSPALTCMFNPKEYTFSKQNNWSAAQNSGSNMPQMEFTNGDQATMTLELYFDTYEKGEDVRLRYTGPLWNLMLVDDRLVDPKSKKKRPPRVRFVWGASWTFDAVITSLSQKFVLFKPDGTPVRAVVNATFKQISDDAIFPRQNPTSGGRGGERIWTVAEGDTLGWIAYKHYGTTARWRLIADANQLQSVRELQPGMTLVIPYE
jgi:hypothetical protein